MREETGGICISPRPCGQGADIRPGMPMRPMFGIEPVIVDEKVFDFLVSFVCFFVFVIVFLAFVY